MSKYKEVLVVMLIVVFSVMLLYVAGVALLEGFDALFTGLALEETGRKGCILQGWPRYSVINEVVYCIRNIQGTEQVAPLLELPG